MRNIDIFYFDEYYSILVKNGYCISDDVEAPAFICPAMFLASLANNRKKRMLVVDYFLKHLRKLVKNIFIKRDLWITFLKKITLGHSLLWKTRLFWRKS